jgi:hypothetical protein
MYSLYKCEGGVLDLTTVNLFKIFKIALVPVNSNPFKPCYLPESGTFLHRFPLFLSFRQLVYGLSQHTYPTRSVTNAR